MDVQKSGLYKQSQLFEKHKVYSLIKSTKKTIKYASDELIKKTFIIC